MASIRSQMLGLESLACDFFPYMWNDLETYDTMPGCKISTRLLCMALALLISEYLLLLSFASSGLMVCISCARMLFAE